MKKNNMPNKNKSDLNNNNSDKEKIASEEVKRERINFKEIAGKDLREKINKNIILEIDFKDEKDVLGKDLKEKVIVAYDLKNKKNFYEKIKIVNANEKVKEKIIFLLKRKEKMRRGD